jgi:superfamily II DNA/RNA helicase
MTCGYPPGTRVRRRSDRSSIGVVVRSDERFATVFWATGHEEIVPVNSLVEQRDAGPTCTPSELFLELVHRRLDHPLTDQLLSYRASRTQLLPHQFTPVRKFVANPSQRLLIADEVGTGKTIEAGLIWAELEARSRGGLGSVLVVCPKALVGKWQAEFLHRFDLRLEHLDSDAWRAALITSQRDGVWNPRFSHAVVGLELARREESLALLGETDCTWDLVIVDEAHELRNPETLSHALGQLLADRAAAMLLLTATPAQTSLEDLRSLFRILSVELAADSEAFAAEIERDMRLNDVARLVRELPPGWRDRAVALLRDMSAPAFGRQAEVHRLNDLLPSPRPTPLERVQFLGAVADAQAFAPYFTRTLRGDVDVQRPVRQAIVHRIAFNEAQQAFYDLVYEIAVVRAQALGMPAGFVSQMPERRTASCPTAVAEEVLALATEREDDRELHASFSEEEVSRLAPLAHRMVDARDDKVETLLAALRDLSAQGYTRVIVFSSFRGTLRYLERRLAAEGFRVVQIHGDVPSRDEDCRPGERSRDAIAAGFRRGEFDILLGSEVIGQGLDFEHCAAVVNYDLPWNPMRVEQRIGRVDRIGQQADKIIIVNFTSLGTIESRILDRLYVRLGVFERALGELELVLGEELELFTRDLFSRALTQQQQDERLDRIARAVEERRRQAALVEEEHGALLSAVQRVEVETAEFKDLERAFLSPDELQRFVVETLCSRCGADAVRERPEGLVEVDLGAVEDELITLSRALPATSSAKERTRRLVARARRGNERLLASFRDAEYHEGIDFVHARHPLVLLCRHLRRTIRSEARVANGVVASRGALAPGRYTAAWAIASYEGLISRVELLELLVDGDGNPVPIPEPNAVLRWLGEAAPASDRAEAHDHVPAMTTLERRLADLASRGRDRLLDRNSRAVVRARQALRSAIDARQRWLAQRLALPGLDARIRRMYASWSARLGRELANKLQDLERHGALEYSCQFLGAAVLTVVAHQEFRDAAPNR